MLRLLGALGVFCALSWCGFQRALWYRQRVDCIAAWQNALREGERQLCDLGIQTPEWLGWIREQKLGLTVKSLEEIPELINRMTEEEYKEMLQNVKKTGEHLREGSSLKKITDEIESNEQ